MEKQMARAGFPFCFPAGSEPSWQQRGSCGAPGGLAPGRGTKDGSCTGVNFGIFHPRCHLFPLVVVETHPSLQLMFIRCVFYGYL